MQPLNNAFGTVQAHPSQGHPVFVVKPASPAPVLTYCVRLDQKIVGQRIVLLEPQFLISEQQKLEELSAKLSGLVVAKQKIVEDSNVEETAAKDVEAKKELSDMPKEQAEEDSKLEKRFTDEPKAIAEEPVKSSTADEKSTGEQDSKCQQNLWKVHEEKHLCNISPKQGLRGAPQFDAVPAHLKDVHDEIWAALEFYRQRCSDAK